MNDVLLKWIEEVQCDARRRVLEAEEVLMKEVEQLRRTLAEFSDGAREEVSVRRKELEQRCTALEQEHAGLQASCAKAESEATARRRAVARASLDAVRALLTASQLQRDLATLKEASWLLGVPGDLTVPEIMKRMKEDQRIHGFRKTLSLRLRKAHDVAAGLSDEVTRLRALEAEAGNVKNREELATERLLRMHEVEPAVVAALKGLPPNQVAYFLEEFIGPKTRDADLEVSWCLPENLNALWFGGGV